MAQLYNWMTVERNNLVEIPQPTKPWNYHVNRHQR